MAEQSARFASTPVHARVKQARLREHPCRHKGIWWVVEGRARSVRLAHTQLSSVAPSEHQQGETDTNGLSRHKRTTARNAVGTTRPRRSDSPWPKLNGGSSKKAF